MIDQRQMDLIRLEAEMRYLEWKEECQRMLLGRRAEYGSETEQYLPGEEWGQLVQRGAEDGDAGEELGAGESEREETGSWSGDQDTDSED